MNRRRLYKKLKKYPFLLDPMIQLSREEALAILDREPLPDFAGEVAAAKLRFTLPAEVWGPGGAGDREA